MEQERRASHWRPHTEMTAEFYTPLEDKARLAATSSRDDPGLPRVLIIGDSISIGYMPTVRKRLAGRANVHRPDANCGDTRAGMVNLDAWLGDGRWAVIHFNFGLHDLCYRHPESKVYGNRDKVRGTQAVPSPQYRKNLETIVARLKQTGAALIWASTTVVPEGEAGRFVEDAVVYNGIAAEIMRSAGVVIEDLFDFTKALPQDAFVAPGDVHYTADASERIGAKVAETIDEALRRA